MFGGRLLDLVVRRQTDSSFDDKLTRGPHVLGGEALHGLDVEKL
jgi:hypothetical protein